MAESVGTASKRKCAGGKLKRSWKLPPGLCASTKGDTYAYCKFCRSHFTVAHGGFNDVSRHVLGSTHQQRLKDGQGTSDIGSMFKADETHPTKVISAEVMMCKFIAMHNLSFQTADHLSNLLSNMFPDSAIASSFSCGHTKTKSIVCDALDPYYNKPIVDNLAVTVQLAL